MRITKVNKITGFGYHQKQINSISCNVYTYKSGIITSLREKKPFKFQLLTIAN